MKLIEALETLRKAASNNEETCPVFLACGFTPLHLKTMLAAELQLRRPNHRVEVETGLYGDLQGNLERAANSRSEAVAVIVEWQDLDPRLGIRSVGGWTPAMLPNILDHVRECAAAVTKGIEKTARTIPVCVSFPTLPLMPISHSRRLQANRFEAELRACVAVTASAVALLPNVKIVNSQWLDEASPLADRFDTKSDVLTGFPYRNPHASKLAEALAELMQKPAPKKGLITDLDETTWKGILGEVGVNGVSWDLDHYSQMHAVYQQLLHALSASGVLIGIASKNDRKLVDEVFEKRGPILPREAVFPIEAHWSPKSESIRRILRAWNISADSVVFVDDSPMELAEVKSAHPEIECIRFPVDDPQGIYELLERLRDLFGKSTIHDEDTIRLESLRRADSMRESGEFAGVDESFLQRADAELAISFNRGTFDPRALELLNKTNQFNLNGKRFTPASLQKYVEQPDSFLMAISYKDKYGPLGKIAVIAGRHTGRKVLVDSWVMSCRAFSRRIEHRCLEELFSRFDAEEIELDFVETPRNEPLRLFLTELAGGRPASPCLLQWRNVTLKQPKTYHRVLELING